VHIHCDGARFFDGVAGVNAQASEISQNFDSLSICLSKGLCSPAGSLLVCNDNELLGECRKLAKYAGGGWRQAGVIAACGIVGLDGVVPMLGEVHK
jgi:threonine aldolase